MTFLEMVQKAIRRSGAKVDEPTTIVGATGLTRLFVEWVQDSWKEIQLERLGWDWRVTRDQTLAITSASDEYAMPTGLETLNLRTVSLYDAVADEVLICYIPYDNWRRQKDLGTKPTGRPLYFTITTNDRIAFYPQPDQNYTVRYDGILSVEILDTTNNSDTPTFLNAVYHDSIVWQAIMHYAKHFEDGSKLSEATNSFLPYKKYFEERSMPDISISVDAMYRR